MTTGIVVALTTFNTLVIPSRSSNTGLVSMASTVEYNITHQVTSNMMECSCHITSGCHQLSGRPMSIKSATATSTYPKNAVSTFAAPPRRCGAAAPSLR